MNQLNKLWNRLSWPQRVWLAVAAVAVSGGIFSLNRWTQERDFKPLFSGLAPEDAGAVTARLREMAVDTDWAVKVPRSWCLRAKWPKLASN